MRSASRWKVGKKSADQWAEDEYSQATSNNAWTAFEQCLHEDGGKERLDAETFSEFVPGSAFRPLLHVASLVLILGRGGLFSQFNSF
jgi:hypothetical protein